MIAKTQNRGKPSCIVCGETESRAVMVEVRTGAYVHDECWNEWEGPRGRTKDDKLVI